MNILVEKHNIEPLQHHKSHFDSTMSHYANLATAQKEKTNKTKQMDEPVE